MYSVRKWQRRFFARLVCIAVFVGMLPLNAAALAPANLGFESDLDEWTVYEDATIHSESMTIAAGPNSWEIHPKDSKMAVMVPSGDAGVFSSIADTLNLSSDTRAYFLELFPGPTNFAYIYRSIELGAAQEFYMYWNYVATDYDPYNDASFVSLVNTDNPASLPLINGAYGEIGILGATVLGTGNYSTGSYGSTGWQRATFKAGSAGTYILGFAVYNLDDTALSPYLFVDDGAGLTYNNGIPFDPIAPDDNAPPPPAVKSIVYDTTTFSEAGANDGSIGNALTVTVVEETFTGNADEEIAGVTFQNAPDGLTPSAIKKSNTTAEINLSGSASNHSDAADIDNFTVIFPDSAFSGNDASTVLGSSNSSIVIDFEDSSSTGTPQAAVIYDDVTKTYGDASFDHTASGGSGTGAFSYSSDDTDVATIDSTTGNVTILQAGAVTLTATKAGDDTYDEASASCTFTVDKKDLTVQVNDTQKYRNDPDPEFTATINGFIDGESIDDLDGLLAFAREPGENTGSYAVSASGFVSDNYSFSYLDGALNIRNRASGSDEDDTDDPEELPEDEILDADEDGTGSLNGQDVKDLESGDARIEVRSGGISYALAASQINIDAISEQFGEDVALEDINVNIRISNLREDEIRVIEDAANANNFLLVVPPVEFEITCESNGQTVSVSRFNSYVERTIPIPAGVDPYKITTGVIINEDGTFSHVPTTIIIIDGVYYARINSLTNSVYSIIYNPFTFSDLDGYWAEDMINNMGARLIVKGTDDNMYEPELDITRAEFATMTVRALGLLPGTEPSRFFDVASDEWYNGYIQTATEYGLITGYEIDEFGPNDKIIREDAMVIIARALKVIGIDVDLEEAEVNELLAAFKDVQNAFPYIRSSIAACLKAEVIIGRYADAIEPKDYITRAEVAVILNRMLRNTELI